LEESNTCTVEDGKLDLSLWQNHTAKKTKFQLQGKKLQPIKSSHTKIAGV